MFTKDYFLQQVLQEKTLARSRRNLGRTNTGRHTERALHCAQHTVKWRAFLRAGRKVDATKHGLFGKFRFAEHSAEQTRQHISNASHLLRQRVRECATRQIGLIEQPLLHTIVNPTVQQIKLTTKRFANRNRVG